MNLLASNPLSDLDPAPWVTPCPAVRGVTVGLIGPGKVGSALLEQLLAARSALRQDPGVDLRLRVVADSRRMWLDHENEHLGPHVSGTCTWRPSSLDAVGESLAGLPCPVLIDCSASDRVASHYAHWLASGIHVVTPNKLAVSGPLERWQAIGQARAGGAQLRYEATVGAGLPVVQTLRDLLATGDTLQSVEGLFSGTLAWLFDGYDGKVPFSHRIREARELGYTEPDPRADLSGEDVARKLVILAREAGMDLSLEQVDVTSLVPPALHELDLETFLERMNELDDDLAERHALAASRGEVLRHVGRLEADGRASVRLLALPADHPLAQGRGCDNIVRFRSRRYPDPGLRVQGPGAGPEVTAAGVFADLLRVAAEARA